MILPTCLGRRLLTDMIKNTRKIIILKEILQQKPVSDINIIDISPILISGLGF